jgi:hypothetical protein
MRTRGWLASPRVQNEWAALRHMHSRSISEPSLYPLHLRHASAGLDVDQSSEHLHAPGLELWEQCSLYVQHPLRESPFETREYRSPARPPPSASVADPRRYSFSCRHGRRTPCPTDPIPGHFSYDVSTGLFLLQPWLTWDSAVGQAGRAQPIGCAAVPQPIGCADGDFLRGVL